MLPDLVIDRGQLFRYLRLFLFQKIKRYRIVVVGFEQFRAFVFERPFLPEQTIHLKIVFFFFLPDDILQFFLDGHTHFMRKLNVFVELFDLSFYLRNEYVARLAIRACTAVPSAACKVGIYLSVLLLRVCDDHPRTAVGAINCSFEEVGMLEVSLPVDPRCEDGLYPFPCVIVYQRLVRSGILHAFVCDDPFVVGVLQYLEERLIGDRLRWHPRG
ncbi:MAG: hypothetical protein LKJ83_02595 [Eubacteriaceae bacterium]|nr:hypothetical protein [Eubacteriaceae bacterium]